MYTIADVLTLDSSWTYRYPEMLAWGDGVLVLLDHMQISDSGTLNPALVTVRRADGSTCEFPRARIEARHGTVGVFLPGANATQVARGDQLSWR